MASSTRIKSYIGTLLIVVPVVWLLFSLVWSVDITIPGIGGFGWYCGYLFFFDAKIASDVGLEGVNVKIDRTWISMRLLPVILVRPTIIDDIVWANFAIAQWLIGVVSVTCGVLLRKRKRRHTAGMCHRCGYDVREIRSGVCPECGERFLQDNS